jgi:hypothetical protein
LREPERDERRRGLGPERVDLFPDLTRPRIGEPLVGDQLEFGFEFTDPLRQGRVEVDVDVPVGAGAAFARARRLSNAVKGLPPYAAGKWNVGGPTGGSGRPPTACQTTRV